ncbi:MAG: M36 family metallopeptidase [Saprospiraceae bacterium]|nr:M36 family metallopeptidase [Saprospiraceae bacterium]
MRSIFTCFATLLLCLLGMTAFAQKQTPLDIALRHMEQNAAEWGLQSVDIADMVVSDTYKSKHNGLTHVFFKQRYASTEIHNAIAGVHVMENGEIGYATSRFYPNIAELVNTTSKSMSAYQAIEVVAEHLELSLENKLNLISQDNDTYLFDRGNIAHSDIKVKPIYQVNDEGKLIYSWEVVIDTKTSSDHWRIAVDANSGEIIAQDNYTVYCSFGSNYLHKHDHNCHAEEVVNFKEVQSALTNQKTATTSSMMGGTYNVYARPVESPAYGDRTLVVDPADPVASPFGWHDTNGEEGAEFTITRGNNVHAYQDRLGINQSMGDEPDGGSELIFDFPLDLETQEPDEYLDAATTQLFYMINTIHDFTFAYGFDEASGNFQQTNYTGAGQGNDFVRGEAQDAFEAMEQGLNNANFATPPDGGNGRMQMYLWNRGGSDLVNVDEPAAIAGGYETGTAQYGPAIGADPVTGLVALAFDGTSNPSQGCNEIINPEEVEGKIAMVDRGTCFFEQKTANAEAAGAIALIICNFEDAVAGMAGVAEIEDPSIPTAMLKSSDCQLIRSTLGAGIDVQVTMQFEDAGGPSFIDGDLDNGVIAHEYGHGIHNRLTGGPGAAGCFGADEQMGEGYADFFALITTVEPGDVGETPRGVGAYASSSNPNGGGIRRLPYSTDKTINDQVYDDIIGTEAPHPLGEIWTGCLWDLYWAFVDVYGFDEDQINGTGGNNMAIQLVMDGLKIQECNPGFVDARNGIIAADLILNGGANECLIWEVFAARGLGWEADQGSNNDRNDGTMSFDPRPECVKELKIAKEATDFIEAGDNIDITLTITNHKDDGVSGVVVTDEIPDGATYIAGSTSGANEPTDAGDMLTFEIGDLASGESLTITYQLSSADEFNSVSQFYDGAEESFLNFGIDALEGVNIWGASNQNPISDNFSWFVPNEEADNDQILFSLAPIELAGQQPVLRFNHTYDTEPGNDGGIVEVSVDGFEWITIPAEDIFRGSYRGQLAYNAFAIPNISGYWGNSNGIVASYADLSAYAGQSIYLRFRFGSDAADAGEGWTVDDIEIIDMFNYNSEACVTSNEGDNACNSAEARGTIVEVGDATSTESLEAATNVAVFPNPANDILNIAVNTAQSQNVTITLVNASGVQIMEKQVNVGIDGQVIPLNVSNLPAGFYFVQVTADVHLATEKVILK